MNSGKQKKQIQEFWDYFVLNNQNIQLVDSDIPFAHNEYFIHLGELLKQINENLTFEFGPWTKDHYGELTLSADGIEEAFPYVETLHKKYASTR